MTSAGRKKHWSQVSVVSVQPTIFCNFVLLTQVNTQIRRFTEILIKGKTCSLFGSPLVHVWLKRVEVRVPERM